MKGWPKTLEYWLCVTFFVWDIGASTAVASRLFSLNEGQATFLGIGILVVGVAYTGTLFVGAARWKVANPDNPAPLGRAVVIGLSCVALILQAVFPYIKAGR